MDWNVTQFQKNNSQIVLTVNGFVVLGPDGSRMRIDNGSTRKFIQFTYTYVSVNNYKTSFKTEMSPIVVDTRPALLYT